MINLLIDFSRRVSGTSTGPPTSNAHTTVWYWSPDNVSTMTVMYTAYNRELWCNGSTISNARVRNRYTLFS